MTDDEKLSIIDLYNSGSNTVEISSMTGRSQSAVERFLKKKGFTNFGKDKASVEDLETIKDLYLNEKLNAQEIWEREYSERFSKAYIERIIRGMGISRGQGRGNYNKTLVHDYFDQIDTQNKAYILGYLFADGSISSYKTLRLECTEKDREILEFVKEEISPESNIHVYSRPSRNSTAVLYISSIDIVRSLGKHGVIKGKQSKDIPLPSLEKDMMRHFIRGYFDGDGSITHSISSTKKKSPSISICVTEEFGRELESILIRDLVMSKPENNIIDMRKYNINIHHLRISRMRDVKSFYDYIYSDAFFFLNRKEEKMRTLLKLPQVNTEVTR